MIGYYENVFPKQFQVVQVSIKYINSLLHKTSDEIIILFGSTFIKYFMK